MNKPTPEPRTAASQSVVTRLGVRPARIPSRVVLGGDREVVIVHGSDEYRLKLTSEDKLELTR